MKEQNEKFDELLENFNKQHPVAPLGPEQNRKISSLALEKIKAQQKQEPDVALLFPIQEKTETAAGKKRVMHRVIRTALVAAVICASTLTVFAVGNQLAQMLKGNIGFFQDAPSRQEVRDPACAPRVNYESGQQALEAFNAPIGQSVSCNGITVTLESISMDVSSMDVFYTISGAEAMKQLIKDRGTRPLWGEFYETGSSFCYPRINGRRSARLGERDWYVDENGELKLWQHFSLSELPEGPVITVELTEYSRILETPGNWAFRVELDGASVRTGGQIVQPGKYPLPGEEGSDLQLQYLAFGPKGGVLRLGNEIVEQALEKQFLITDDTGKELHVSQASGNARGNYNLTLPDEGAAKLIFTPIKIQKEWYGAAKTETHSVSLEELQNGVKIQSNDCGGYTVQNFTIRDSSVFFELVPFGWNFIYGDGTSGGSGESSVLWPELDEDLPQERMHTFTVVPQTGVVSVRYDFYETSQQQLENGIKWNYEYTHTKQMPEKSFVLDLQNVG